MIDQSKEKAELQEQFPVPRLIDRVRWEAVRNRSIDELAKGGVSLRDLAAIASVEEGQLRIWLNDADDFPVWGRRVGEKSMPEKIAEALEQAFKAMDDAGINTALRCPVRVRTSVVEAICKGFRTARRLCEFVEISGPPGVGKSEGMAEALARFRKEEGFSCPVWSIKLDETCVNIKAVLILIARAVCESRGFDDRSEFSLRQSIERGTEGRHGVLAVDEGQHLADVMRRLGIPIINQLRSFVDDGLFGIVYFGNGEIYRRLKAGTAGNRGAYTQILSRMQDFRVEISGYDPTGKKSPCLTRQDVLAVAAAWGVSGAEEIAWCLKAVARPGTLRTMTNAFRRVLAEHDEITLAALNSLRTL
jgi:hypothetical protein